MGFRINTNIAAMNAHRNSTQTNLNLDKSLQALSSGLRINTAADDASGLAIANSLRAQSTGLGQAINNANDGIGVTQTADGALDEYENIINTVRTKSIQAASDGQNDDSRKAIQRDISKLLDEAQNIAETTSFNGQKLLDGTFTDKNFQIGAYAKETVGISIQNAQTTSLGQYANSETQKDTIGVQAIADLDVNVNGVSIGAVAASATAAAKAAAVNNVTSSTGVTATASTELLGADVVAGGTIAAGSVFVNDIDLGDVTFSSNDGTGTLVQAFNNIQDQTGVKASIENGALKLTDKDGGDIKLTLAVGGAVIADADRDKLFSAHAADVELNEDAAANLTNLSQGAVVLESDSSIQLTYANNGEASMGFSSITGNTVSLANAVSSVDVSTYDGAQKGIKQADAALRQLDAIRSNIGSTQNQLESTVRNISVTQVNVAAAESQIRDVDFAAESANFAKHNILAQSGSYAMSQANAVQQNVMRLLQ